MVSVVETIDKPFQSNEDNITSTINLLESIHKYVPNIKVFLRFLCCCIWATRRPTKNY